MPETVSLTSKGVIRKRMHHKEHKIRKPQQVQMERGHEQQYNCVQVLVECQPDAFRRERLTVFISLSDPNQL